MSDSNNKDIERRADKAVGWNDWLNRFASGAAFEQEELPLTLIRTDGVWRVTINESEVHDA